MIPIHNINEGIQSMVSIAKVCYIQQKSTI